MKTMMNMSNSEIEQDTIEYGEEIMSAGWNPAVEQVCELMLGSPAGASLSTSVMFED